jgi:hypothetical protein
MNRLRMRCRQSLVLVGRLLIAHRDRIHVELPFSMTALADLLLLDVQRAKTVRVPFSVAIAFGGTTTRTMKVC